jgi:hypothetical protein
MTRLAIRPPYIRQPASPMTWVLAALVVFYLLARHLTIVFFVLALVLAALLFGGPS